MHLLQALTQGRAVPNLELKNYFQFFSMNLNGVDHVCLESRTCNPKVESSSLGPAGIVGGGSECTALSQPQCHD